MKMDRYETERRHNLIEDYLNGEIKVGDPIKIQDKYLTAPTHRDENEYTTVHVMEILPDGNLKVRNTGYPEDDYYGKATVIDPKKVEIKKDPLWVGVYPFASKNWMSCCRHTGLGLSHIIFKIEEIIENDNVGGEFDGVKCMEFNFNPYVLDKDGNKMYFQRDYCWTLEDEQNFIESIYNYLNLGTVVLRKRSYKYIESECKKGNREVAYYDVIDGKQRIHTLMRFMKNEFPDKHGNYYGDFSEFARRTLINDVMGLDVMEIQERATDEDVLSVFLNVNYAGKPMSAEHLKYVRSLYNKI